MSVRKSDHIERRKIALMRKADTEAGATHNIGGVRKKEQRAKPSLPKMPWDEPMTAVADTDRAAPENAGLLGGASSAPDHTTMEERGR